MPEVAEAPRVETEPEQPFVDPSNEAARMRALGIQLDLGGEYYRIKFTYEALELIEQEFEGVDEFRTKVNDRRYKKDRLRSLRVGITAGLLHTKPEAEDLLVFEKRIKGLLQPQHLLSYQTAVLLAMVEAFPPPNEDDLARPKEPEKLASSRGPGFSTSRRLDSARPKRRSGK